jgi:predicted NAD-dependent protein-ADP-ribosyltransferase YbiA (DUF1768 family)
MNSIEISYGRQQKDRIYYTETSLHKHVGFGVNEYANNYQIYDSLYSIKNWRRQLSDRYPFPFTYNNKRYHTVNHCLNACRLLSSDNISLKLIGHKLSLDYDEDRLSDLNINVKNCNSVCQKIILSHDNEIQWKSDVTIVYYDILMAKFNSDDKIKDILLKTKNAELMSHLPIFISNKQNDYRNITLEKVRVTVGKP